MRRLNDAMAVLIGLNASAMAAERLPVETFSRQFTYDSVALSPDGGKIAVSYVKDDFSMLGVVDLANGKAQPVAGVKRPDELGGIWWKTDDRILYRAYMRDQNFDHVSVLRAVNADGRNLILLNFNPQPSGWYTHDEILDLNFEDPQTILMASESEEHDFPLVYRVNVQRGQSSALGARSGPQFQWPSARKALFKKPPARDCTYDTDLAGEVRICVAHETDRSRRLLYRSDENAPWVELAHYEADQPSMYPLGFTPDNRRLYVSSNIGRDTRALFEYDPETKSLGKLLFEANGLDLDDPVRSADGRRLIAVTYHDKGSGIFYLDPHLMAVHEELNKAFGKLQVSLQSASRDGNYIIAWVGDASTPGTYYLYDGKKSQVREITAIAPWIDRKSMAVTRAVAFDARDGMHLNGYLTLPRGGPDRNLPLIVNVHGGPIGIRDVATFDRETQLFANRGYAVLQVNFRGSGGYGREFRAAGEREWGGKMQTDLEDGVQWLVKRGTVDPAKVGIFGGSYGGYAAMMALVTAPDLYKCAVSYAGISNLVRMLNERTRYANSGLRRKVSRAEQQFWERVIGDRHDEAALEAVSPVFNVEKIKAPVFIAHGGDDLTVPVVEATELERALRRAGKPVEMLIVPHEGHGFFREQSRRIFYERMDAFFGKCLPVS